MPNVKKIWGLHLPGTPWATSACCGRLLPFTVLSAQIYDCYLCLLEEAVLFEFHKTRCLQYIPCIFTYSVRWTSKQRELYSSGSGTEREVFYLRTSQLLRLYGISGESRKYEGRALVKRYCQRNTYIFWKLPLSAILSTVNQGEELQGVQSRTSAPTFVSRSVMLISSLSSSTEHWFLSVNTKKGLRSIMTVVYKYSWNLPNIGHACRVSRHTLFHFAMKFLLCAGS